MNFNTYEGQICGIESPGLLGFDFSTAPSLLFYSYIPIVIFSLIVSLVILFKDRKSIQSKTLFSFTIFFVVWVVNILIQWVNSFHTVLMFAWQLTLFFEIGIYISASRLSYVFLFKRDIPSKIRLIMNSFILLSALIIPTRLNISAYDILNCEGVTGIAWPIAYIVELSLIVVIAYFGQMKFRESNDLGVKKQAALFSFGMVIFLTVFFLSNFYGELTKVYEFNLWGPLGMVIFIALLAYNIVKFKLFNLKLIGANVLVFSLWLLIGSLLAIQDISVSHTVTSITLIISVIFGFILIKSIRREVYQRERIELLAKDLQTANTRLLDLDRQKSEFVSFATHQLRAPLTAMKGYTSLILEGEMGETSSEVKQAVSRIFDSSSTLTHIVDDYLNISRIELGTMKYNFEIIDLKELTDNVIGELKPNIEKKGLKLSFNSNSSTRYIVHADKDKIKQVIANLIDNSVKYTPAGSVDISISRNTKDRKIIFSIKDTGVGISPEVMPKLFTKFVRAENANKQNIYGTGLGLYVAKEIVTAHKGRIWAESQGEGKGSTFFLELDMEV